jgi:alkylation response protein AidB-like acyl-CoA dehydrogenase
MRGVLDLTVAYAAERRQFGVPVGSFQAVQHLLAEAVCLMEGSLSVALHAAWAVDPLDADEARAAGQVAKAYCARSARIVCESAIRCTAYRQHLGCSARVPAPLLCHNGSVTPTNSSVTWARASGAVDGLS